MVDDSFVRAHHDARVVVAAAVAALSSSGDKYGAKLQAWLAGVVDGERPLALPRLDDLRLSVELFRRRQLAKDVAKAYKDFVHARWSAGGRKRKKVERQAERRKSRRQLEEPMSADCYYDGFVCDDDDDDDDVRPPHSHEPIDESCSDYELERLRTIVKNARALVSIFATGHGKDEADKAEKGLRQAEKMLEAEEAIHWSAAQHKIEEARKKSVRVSWRLLHGTTRGRMRACNDNDNDYRQQARM